MFLAAHGTVDTVVIENQNRVRETDIQSNSSITGDTRDKILRELGIAARAVL